MDEPCFYGFPTYGEAGPEGRRGRRRPADHGPRAQLRAATEAAGARLDAFMAAHLPGSVGPEIYTKTCLYTMPPDRDFVIDRLPGPSRGRSSPWAPPMPSSSARSSAGSSPS